VFNFYRQSCVHVFTGRGCLWCLSLLSNRTFLCSVSPSFCQEIPSLFMVPCVDYCVHKNCLESPLSILHPHIHSPLKPILLFLGDMHVFFYIHRAVYCIITPIVKPTSCTNVSNLFILERHCTYFRRSFCPSSAVQDCTCSNRYLSDSNICLTNACCCMFSL